MRVPPNITPLYTGYTDVDPNGKSILHAVHLNPVWRGDALHSYRQQAFHILTPVTGRLGKAPRHEVKRI